MINLNDILRLDDLKNYKIRLNQKINEYKADEVYFNDKDRFKEANAYNGKNKQLNRPYLITFAEYSNHKDLWIFTGVYKVNDYKTKTTNEQGHALAQLEKIDDFEKFDGRLIVSFHKEMQAYVLKAEEFIERFQVHEICNEILNGEHFDNYYNIDLTFNQLNNIIRTQKQDWKTALENCKAVYLIRDSFNGKLYVGSATAQNGMLWSRWSQYINNGHGGNIKLKELVAEKGIDYLKNNFHYSILENFTPSTDDETVLEREYYYHKILQSNKFGYNAN